MESGILPSLGGISLPQGLPRAAPSEPSPQTPQPSPVIGELQLQSGMIRCFYGDDIRKEIRSEEKTEGTAGMGTFGPPSREGQHCELLFRTQQHQLWPKDHTEGRARSQVGGEPLPLPPRLGPATHRALFSL